MGSFLSNHSNFESLVISICFVFFSLPNFKIFKIPLHSYLHEFVAQRGSVGIYSPF